MQELSAETYDGLELVVVDCGHSIAVKLAVVVVVVVDVEVELTVDIVLR